MNFELQLNVRQLSLSLRSLVQRRPVSSGLLERRACRLHRLRQRRAVVYFQRRSRSTFLLLTLLTTCLLQQCIARPRQLWTEIRSGCCAIILFVTEYTMPFFLYCHTDPKHGGSTLSCEPFLIQTGSLILGSAKIPSSLSVQN